MTRLYCVEGRIKGNDANETRAHWPVCYRIDPDDAQTIKQKCEEQRDQFLKEVQALDDQRPKQPMRPGRRASAHEQGSYRNAFHEWRLRNTELNMREAELITKWSPELLDPLLPLGGSGSLSVISILVEYEIVEFWDDPREMGEAELMKLRVKLHPASEDEYNPDEDDY